MEPFLRNCYIRDLVFNILIFISVTYLFGLTVYIRTTMNEVEKANIATFSQVDEKGDLDVDSKMDAFYSFIFIKVRL